ncbi:MAG: heme NO-binding domain-containing protein [Pseudomonadota bacterium]
MKGIIYTELLEFVEGRFSDEFVQRLINAARLESKGVYTASGTYPTCEFSSLLNELSKASNVEQPEWLRDFGRHLFGRFAARYPDIVNRFDNAVDLIKSLDKVHQSEIIALYPDAEFPRFSDAEANADGFSFIYKSFRGMSDFCHGLLEGCLQHYGMEARIEARKLPSAHEEQVAFTIYPDRVRSAA